MFYLPQTQIADIYYRKGIDMLEFLHRRMKKKYSQVKKFNPLIGGITLTIAFSKKTLGCTTRLDQSI